MENTFISFGFLVSLIGVIAKGPGDLNLETEFANTYDNDVFLAATTDPRIRCERAWTLSEDNDDINEFDNVELFTDASKTIRFSSSLNHADIQNLSLLRCQLSFILTRIRRHDGTSQRANSLLWLSDVDESGLTYVLKSDPGGSGKLDIIEKINIPEGNLAFQIDFSYSHGKGYFTPAQRSTIYRCQVAWAYSFKGAYPSRDILAWQGQLGTVKFSPVLQFADIIDMFTKCEVRITSPRMYNSTVVFWLSEGEGEHRLTYILKTHDSGDGLKIVDRMIIN